ncbi:hypothetical protein RxyAA322_24820 [Rubrobacter xylanophilus]|uniref:N-acetylmuramoyl-L-alanine amidase n=1 Tax=Rubrobacter xylanophilus TaxID=49319 RepID=A0A510HLF5_9ACTN|nr:hypothetical protein RxyAA322_24820 [Rubrobacter xylanophilus]
MQTNGWATPPSMLSRRDFIKMSGAGVAGAALLGVLSTSNALAQASPAVSSEVGAASKEHGVPTKLLLAMGYVSSRWEMPPPRFGDFNPGDIHGTSGYGVLGLSADPKNDTLSRASELTGIPEEELKTDRAANVEGAAAVLSALQGSEKPKDVNGWYDAVAKFGGGALYANEVYEVLRDGASAETSSGRVTIEPQPEAEPRDQYTFQAAGDYPNSTWYGAYSGNYTNASRPGSNPINKVIVHVMQGSFSSAINWFKDPRAGVSCHYNVRSSDGFIGQSVREEDIAWHAGNWEYNQTSVGIEHEGYISDPSWFTDAMYHSSAKLTAYLCKKYKIPIDRDHIIGHNEVPGCSGTGGGSGCHTDPGKHWNWSRYMDLVKSYANAETQRSKPEYRQVIDNGHTRRFKASGKWSVSSWNSQRFREDYRYTKPLNVEDPAMFKVRIPSRDVYVVQARWPADSGYSGRVTFRIRTANGWVSRTVSQRERGDRWNTLGRFEMPAGDGWWVRISSKSKSSGYIIADAVRILKK